MRGTFFYPPSTSNCCSFGKNQKLVFFSFCWFACCLCSIRFDLWRSFSFISKNLKRFKWPADGADHCSWYSISCRLSALAVYSVEPEWRQIIKMWSIIWNEQLNQSLNGFLSICSWIFNMHINICIYTSKFLGVIAIDWARAGRICDGVFELELHPTWKRLNGNEISFFLLIFWLGLINRLRSNQSWWMALLHFSPFSLSLSLSFSLSFLVTTRRSDQPIKVRWRSNCRGYNSGGYRRRMCFIIAAWERYKLPQQIDSAASSPPQ